MKCDICQCEYEPMFKQFGGELLPVAWSSQIRITLRRNKMTAIHSFNVCDMCAKTMIQEVYRRKEASLVRDKYDE